MCNWYNYFYRLDFTVFSVVEVCANDLALWVFKASIDALHYVIFFGGPDRIFEPKHHEIFNKDLQVNLLISLK